MRFLKAQTTSRGINADTKGLNIDALGLAELNTDNAIRAVTGFVNLLSVLLKLTNKIKMNKEVTKGNKGMRVVEFMKFPTKIIHI